MSSSFHALLSCFHKPSTAKVYASFLLLSRLFWTAFWHTPRSSKPFLEIRIAHSRIRTTTNKDLFSSDIPRKTPLLLSRSMLLGQIVLQTLHLPLLAIFQHPLLIPSPLWPKGNSSSSAAVIDCPLYPVVTRIHMSRHVMCCLWTATNTYANAKAINTAMMDQAWRMRWLMGYFDCTITREFDVGCVVAQRLYSPHILGIQADYRYENCF